MTATRAELFDLVHQFYPRGLIPISRIHLTPGEAFYDDTEEHLRLMAAAARGRREYSTWDAMLDRLRVRFTLQNESLHLLSGGIDPAYSARVWLNKFDTSINFHVSLLGPYYGLQLPGAPDEESVAQAIAREIEATYAGYHTIPSEIGNEVVPDVHANAGFGKATIYTCLFSELWTRVYRGDPA